MKLIARLFSSVEIRKKCVSQREKLYRTAYSWCHETQLADDLVQETMLKALKSYKNLHNPDAIDPWLFKILRNCWHDYLRLSGRTTEFSDREDEALVAPHNRYHSMQIVERVRYAVAELPLPLREVVILADFSGFTYAEIAEIVEIPIGTVMSRLFRARKALKSLLLDLDQTGNNMVKLRRVK